MKCEEWGEISDRKVGRKAMRKESGRKELEGKEQGKTAMADRSRPFFGSRVDAVIRHVCLAYAPQQTEYGRPMGVYEWRAVTTNAHPVS